MSPHHHDEERPLLSSDSDDGRNYSSTGDGNSSYEIRFTDDDQDNPRLWSSRAKITNVAIIALMAIVSPLASSMFAPGISQIAEDLNTTEQAVIATTTGYVIMLGMGPLVLAPFSETFGRRIVYIVCFSIFALLQIPIAFSPNIGFLIAVRSISGFFGSVGIANGGGTISDMYDSRERAGVFGWYLLGPLLGPTLGKWRSKSLINLQYLTSCTRPFVRWYHRHEARLEVGVWNSRHHLRSQHCCRILFLARNLCACHSRAEEDCDHD